MSLPDCHLPEFRDHTPDINRVLSMHSYMTAHNFAPWNGNEGHRPYGQGGHDEQELCYLCVLLNENARKDAEITRLNNLLSLVAGDKV